MSCNENACTKEELVQAINTYATARATSDPNLVQFAGNLLNQYLETLAFKEAPSEFEDEDQPEVE